MTARKPPSYGYKFQQEVAEAVSAIRDKTVLPRMHELLLKELARHANWQTGTISIGTRRLAELLRVTRDNLLTYFDALIELGAVEVVRESRQHESREVRINIEVLRSVKSAPRRAEWERNTSKQPDFSAVPPNGTADDSEPRESSGPISEVQRSHSQDSAVPFSQSSGPTQWDQKGYQSTERSLKEESSSSFLSPPAPAAYGGAGVRAPSTGEAVDAMGHTVDLQTWRSCWDRINVLAHETPHVPDLFDHIRQGVLDHCPAVASDSRLGPAIRFVIER